VNRRLKPQAESSTQEVLAGLVERVTFHNAENGFCVIRIKARGHRELVTTVGHAATIAAGEWVTASGEWVNDRTHGQQFSLFVIARNSCFTYKGRAVEIRQVGRELGVRYVLEGSLRKSGNRIRVTAQLVEAETGSDVWAERYDRDLADIFAVQDEISEAVTIAIAPAIAGAEQRRAMRKPPDSLDAWAAYQRGLWHVSRAKPDNNALAQKFFQQAMDLDPNFAGAIGVLHLRNTRRLAYLARAI
jgi:hypothetical protein